MQLHNRIGRLPIAGRPRRQTPSRPSHAGRSASLLRVVAEPVEAPPAVASQASGPWTDTPALAASPAPKAPAGVAEELKQAAKTEDWASKVSSATRSNEPFKRNENSITITSRSSVEEIVQLILQHPAINDSSKSSTTRLRLVCLPDSLPRTIQAVAEANMRLTAVQGQYRLQVSSSVSRQYGISLYRTLDSGSFKAFLFLNLVPAASVPPEDGLKPIRVSNKSFWNGVSKYLQYTFEEGASNVLMSGVGYAPLTSMYKAVMLARYYLVRGSTANSTQTPATAASPAPPAPTEAATTTAAAAAAPASGDSAQAPRTPRGPPTVDLAFVPTSEKQVINSEKSITITRLHIFKCDPPAPSASAELRLATPRPSRASSPRPDTTRPRSDSQQPRPRFNSTNDEDYAPARPNTVPSRGRSSNRAPRADENTVVVSTEEWKNMNAKLESMAATQTKLMDLLANGLPQQQPQPAVVPHENETVSA